MERLNQAPFELGTGHLLCLIQQHNIADLQPACCEIRREEIRTQVIQLKILFLLFVPMA
jgi:hypothetical protein